MHAHTHNLQLGFNSPHAGCTARHYTLFCIAFNTIGYWVTFTIRDFVIFENTSSALEIKAARDS